MHDGGPEYVAKGYEFRQENGREDDGPAHIFGGHG